MHEVPQVLLFSHCQCDEMCIVYLSFSVSTEAMCEAKNKIKNWEKHLATIKVWVLLLPQILLIENYIKALKTQTFYPVAS